MAAVAFAVAAQSANANTITVTTDLSVSNYFSGTFGYGVEFSSTSNVQLNDGFVIYDFAGFTGASFSGMPGGAAAWDVSYTNGVGGLTLRPAFGAQNALYQTNVILLGGIVDDPDIKNVVFRYIGGGYNASPLGSTNTIQLFSKYAVANPAETYLSEDSTLPGGSMATGPVHVAVENENELAVTPLPAAAWGGMALFGLVAVKRRRKLLCA